MPDHPEPSLYGETKPNSDEEIRPLGLMDQISGVFSEPVALLKRLSKNPQWIGAMLLLTALATVFVIAYFARADALELARMQLERAQLPLSGADLDKAVEMAAKFAPVGGVLGTLFMTPFTIFFFGLIYWVIGLVSAEGPQWKPTYFHGLVAASIPGLVTVPYFLLGTVMAFINPVGAMRPDQIIPSSLGYWLETDSSKAIALFPSIDVFQIFQFVILFFAAKYALRTKTWGAVLCMAFALLVRCVPVFFVK